MAFWTDITNPKRKYNFQVSINGANGKIKNYFAKTATKPSWTKGTAEHAYLNHTFYYPGRLTWGDVQITFVDPGDGDNASEGLVSILEASGYNPPENANDRSTISKSKAVAALGTVTIQQLDDSGGVIETWNLINAFITECNFGDLDYTSDDLVELQVTIKYDFATFGLGSSAERLKP